MNSSNKLFLILGGVGVALGILGNLLKKSDWSFGKPIHIIGIACICIFWMFSIWDVFRNKFWSKETKLKYSLLVIFLPILGPFIYHYYREDLIKPDNTN